MSKETETQEHKQVEGLNLSGPEVEQLNDKTFTIYEEPTYEEFQQEGKDPKRSMVIQVELANGTRASWYPNKSCQKVITAARGRDLHDWVGYKGEFIVKDQKVAGNDKKVIYLKD